jgi:hypothetical protein
MRIGVTRTDGGVRISEGDRAEMLKDIDSAPWFVRPMLRAIAADPEAFRARIFTVMARVFFALLPVFAAIVSMFYRGRTFPTWLVFAVHVHAFAFIVFTVSEAAKFTYSQAFAGGVGALAALAFAIYALGALRAVFGGRWPMTMLKAAGIGFLYSIASLPAFAVILVWASWT